MFCPGRKAVLGYSQTSTTREKKSWQNHSMTLSSWHIVTVSISSRRHKNCSNLFVVPHPVGLQERVMATCLSGIPARRCNASSKRKVPKWSLRSCSKLSTTRRFWRYGISPHPFHLNIETDEAACNSLCTQQTTSSFGTHRQVGSSANRLKNSADWPRNSPIGTCRTSLALGAIPQGKHTPQNMDSPTKSGRETK